MKPFTGEGDLVFWGGWEKGHIVAPDMSKGDQGAFANVADKLKSLANNK